MMKGCLWSRKPLCLFHPPFPVTFRDARSKVGKTKIKRRRFCIGVRWSPQKSPGMVTAKKPPSHSVPSPRPRGVPSVWLVDRPRAIHTRPANNATGRPPGARRQGRVFSTRADPRGAGRAGVGVGVGGERDPERPGAGDGWRGIQTAASQRAAAGRAVTQ